MSDLINTLLVIWFIGSLLGWLWYFNSKTAYVFRTAIIGHIGHYTQGSNYRTINAIDDLGNNITFLMKCHHASNYKVGDVITVTVQR